MCGNDQRKDEEIHRKTGVGLCASGECWNGERECLGGWGLLAGLIHKKGSVVKEEGGQMVEDVKGWSRGRFQEALTGGGGLNPLAVSHPPL